MSIDRVKPLGFETPADGGTETDHLPTELKPSEDYVSAKGLSIEHSTDKRIEQEGGNAGYRDEFSNGFVPFNSFKDLVTETQNSLKVIEVGSDPSCGLFVKSIDELFVMNATNDDFGNISLIDLMEC
jgi:hypothetical protein